MSVAVDPVLFPVFEPIPMHDVFLIVFFSFFSISYYYYYLFFFVVVAISTLFSISSVSLFLKQFRIVFHLGPFVGF